MSASPLATWLKWFMGVSGAFLSAIGVFSFSEALATLREHDRMVVVLRAETDEIKKGTYTKPALAMLDEIKGRLIDLDHRITANHIVLQDTRDRVLKLEGHAGIARQHGTKPKVVPEVTDETHLPPLPAWKPLPPKVGG